MKVKQRDPRLTARVDDKTQQFVAQAADLAGMSLSQFLVEAARDKAVKVTELMTRIQVSSEAADRMMQALDESSEPNALLQRALDKRQELIATDILHPNNESTPPQ